MLRVAGLEEKGSLAWRPLGSSQILIIIDTKNPSVELRRPRWGPCLVCWERPFSHCHGRRLDSTDATEQSQKVEALDTGAGYRKGKGEF